MKAVVLERAGGPEGLIYRDYPDPEAGVGEVVVRLKAAALNHRDIWQRQQAARVPIILGSDGVGLIESLGEDVDGWQAGDEVIVNPSLGWLSGDDAPPSGWRILGGPDDGTYAELVRVPAECVIRKPDTLSYAEAATLGVAGTTAWRALVTRAQVKARQSVLILGIGGGAATFLLQIAKSLGATAFVTSSSDDKLARAKAMGADVGINYRTSDWVAEVLRLTEGRGVDVVVDSSGQQTWPGSIKAARNGGKVVVFGVTTGPTATVNIREVFSKQLSILGTMAGNAQEFAMTVKLYANGPLRPVIHTQMPLAEAAAAHRLMEAGDQFGKIVMNIGE